MDRENFGKFIRTLRQEKNLTQRDLAKDLNLTDKAISKWERGLSFPDITSLEILSNIFGITVSELIGCEKCNQHNKKINWNKPLRFVLQCVISGVMIVILAFCFLPLKSSSYTRTVSISYDSYESLGKNVEALVGEEIPFEVQDGFISCDSEEYVEQFLAVVAKEEN